jgi:hypothetical protein
MNDHKQIVGKLEDDSLSDPTETLHFLTHRSGVWRVVCPKDGWGSNPETLKFLPEKPFLQSVQIDDYVRQFRHSHNNKKEAAHMRRLFLY